MKKDVPLCINFLTKKTPYKGPSADSEEKHEPVSDIDTAAADGLKVLDPKRPIREADIHTHPHEVRFFSGKWTSDPSANSIRAMNIGFAIKHAVGGLFPRDSL